MTTTLIKMTEEQFDATYSLRENHLNPNASWTFDDQPGCLFETYGEEIEFVRQQKPANIWTLINGDDGDLYLVSGYHFVNRIGYLLSIEPVPEGIDIEVRIPMGHDDCNDDEGI